MVKGKYTLPMGLRAILLKDEFYFVFLAEVGVAAAMACEKP